MPRTRTRPAPADRLAAFWTVVADVRAMSPEDVDRHQAAYEAAVGANLELAGDGPLLDRIVDAALASGRYARNPRNAAWVAIDGLCCTIGGSADVAIAVLCRDLISDEDYQAVTGWWRAQGLVVPGEGA